MPQESPCRMRWQRRCEVSRPQTAGSGPYDRSMSHVPHRGRSCVGLSRPNPSWVAITKGGHKLLPYGMCGVVEGEGV